LSEMVQLAAGVLQVVLTMENPSPVTIGLIANNAPVFVTVTISSALDCLMSTEPKSSDAGVNRSADGRPESTSVAKDASLAARLVVSTPLSLCWSTRPHQG
jgi:hypothetical protein